MSYLQIQNIENVHLSYNFEGTQLDCSGLSLPLMNATVQDVMNFASLWWGGHPHCSGEEPVQYTADYVRNYGNVLRYVIQAGTHCMPNTPNYNTTSEGWQLFQNNVPVNNSMSAAPVSSGDHILWKFVKLS